MLTLHTLSNTDRPHKTSRRVGRGVGSKRGKTCGRGSKGDKARSGFKNHFGLEGGQLPLFRKLPVRGFSNERFRKHVFPINLSDINERYQDGEVVNVQTLEEKGYVLRRMTGGIKILADGELKKKVTIEAQAFSEKAKEKLDKLSISYKVVGI